MIGRFLGKLAALLCAFVFLQAPFFISEYQQQLFGRIAELKLQVAQLEKLANGKPLPQYIARFIANSDPDVSRHGLFLNDILTRYQDLQQASASLAEATVYTKPFVFIRVAHASLIQETASHYTLGVTFTIESAIYALIGYLFGMALFIPLRRALPARPS